MSEKATEEEIKEEVQYQAIADFLESTPPNQRINISDIASVKRYGNGGFDYIFRTPEIQLHCNNDKCNGTRFFRCVSGQDKYVHTKDYKKFQDTHLLGNVLRLLSLMADISSD